MIIHNYKCLNCKAIAEASVYVPYRITKEGEKQYLSHPGDYFTYAAMKKELGEEISNERYGHDNFYYDVASKKIIGLDPDKTDIMKKRKSGEILFVHEAIEKGDLECPQCGGKEFKLNWISIS